MSRLAREDIERARSRFRLSDLIGQTVDLKREGNQWRGLCPFHSDNNPSMTVRDDLGGHGRWTCWSCGETGDAIEWQAKIGSVSFRQACADLTGDTLPVTPISEAQRKRDTEKADRKRGYTEKLARKLWDEALPLPDTPAAMYLEGRGLKGFDAPSLRYHPQCEHKDTGLRFPTLLARIDAPSGQLCGVQRTYLTGSPPYLKANVAKPKMALGSIRGGAVRLSAPGRELVIAEGIENAASLQAALSLPAWAVTGTAFLPMVQLPDVVRCVVIGADRDEAGIKAAREAKAAFEQQGRQVRVMCPKKGAGDWNDIYRENKKNG